MVGVLSREKMANGYKREPSEHDTAVLHVLFMRERSSFHGYFSEQKKKMKERSLKLERKI